MKIGCKIIEDLLPLYAEDVCSEESRRLVEEHCAKCEKCREKSEAMNAPLPEKRISGGAKNPFKKAKRRYFLITVIVGLLTIALCVPLAIDSYEARQVEQDFAKMFEENKNDASQAIDDLKNKGFAALLKAGNFKEAFECIEIAQFDNGRITDAEEREYVAADFTAIFEEFFKDYKITDYSFMFEGSYYDNFTLRLNIENSKKEELLMILGFTVSHDNGDYWLNTCELEYSDKNKAAYEEAIKEFPWLTYPGSGFRTSLIKAIRYHNYKDFYSLVRSDEFWYYNSAQDLFVSSESDRLFESFGDEFPYEDYESVQADVKAYRERKEQQARALFEENYTYISSMRGIARRKDSFMTDKYRDSVFRVYTEDMTINMQTRSGEDFSVTFTANVTWSAVCAPFENITYSENTPEEFKRDFEELFS